MFASTISLRRNHNVARDAIAPFVLSFAIALVAFFLEAVGPLLSGTDGIENAVSDPLTAAVLGCGPYPPGHARTGRLGKSHRGITSSVAC